MDVSIANLVALMAVAIALVSYFFRHCISDKPVKKIPGPGFLGQLKVNWQLITGGKLTNVSMELAKKYGPLSYCYIMGQDMCFVSDEAMASRLLDGDTKLKTSDRLVTVPVQRFIFGGDSVTFGGYSQLKKVQRKLFFKVLANSGLNNDEFLQMYKDEQRRLLDKLLPLEGQDIHLDSMLADSLNRTLYLLMHGQLENEDILVTSMDLSALLSKLAAPQMLAMLSTFSILFYLPGVRGLSQRGQAKRDEILNFLLSREHVPSDVTECHSFVDSLRYFQTQPKFDLLKGNDLRGFIISVLIAAQMTTRAAVLGLILSLINCPEVVTKIQHEIDTVIGPDREPEPSDKANMPYMNAVLMENFRHISLNPFVARNASENFEFEGYTIPKDAQILINNWYLTKNEDGWSDPFGFNPDRFLDENENLLPVTHPNRQRNIPFGMGLRRCPGEVFAVRNIFLKVTSLLQNFDILPPVNEKTVLNDPRGYLPGLALLPPPFKCRVLRRKL